MLFQRAFRTRVRTDAPELPGSAHDSRLPAVHFRAGFSFLRLRRFCCFRGLDRTSFPTSDNGQFRLHFRAKTGTRIEETARLCDLIDQIDPARDSRAELECIVDNIGLPYSGINTIVQQLAA